MLERIALHQTRLRTPGLGLDSKGVALGSKGLVLLPSIDRVVAFLAVYTRERSLEDVMPSLAMRVVRSKLGTREVTLELAAESSDRMDRVAETARLVGGFTFTGTSRHFVQYRDAAGPFGYDATDLLSSEEPLLLYHERFTQAYEAERDLELRPLLLRLEPRLDPSTRREAGARVLVAEPGLGPALVHYLVRSRVEGEVGVAEWPPESAFDDAPVRRWILRVPELPPRMAGLASSTPGITCFLPAAPGVAVELGYRHPVELRACPVFDPAGLVLLRGRGAEPWYVPRLPPMGALADLTRVELRADGGELRAAVGAGAVEPVRVELRVVPSSAPWRNVTASWLAPGEVPLLRRLAYALPRATLAQATIALTPRGAFLRSRAGVEGIPLGTFFFEVHPGLYVPAGHEVAPAVAPDVLARAIAAPAGKIAFLEPGGRTLLVDELAFAPLESALVDAPAWDELTTREIAGALDEPIDLRVGSVGSSPGAASTRPEAMARDLVPVANRLYEDVMAPLVLGGPLRPGHAIGGRVALTLGATVTEPRVDPDLVARVQQARVARARELAPVDVLAPPTPAEWALAAALHDALCAANPGFASVLRRGAAARILDVALETLARIDPPGRVGDALSRHAWLARVFDVTRSDTEVSWWTGSKVYRGEEAPARLRAWPELRRVTVTTTARAVLDLEPLGVRRESLVEAMRRLLACSPLTDLATCTRTGPEFTWTDAALALAATRAGQTLALRALARLPAAAAHGALGRAMSGLEGTRLGVARELMAARAAMAGASPGIA